MRSPTSSMHLSVMGGATATQEFPPELLAYIFELAQPRRYTPNKNPRIEVTLSHVSGYWRAVALTEPRLWTHIDIHSNQSMKRIAKYLQRSGPRLLLDINVDIYRYDKALTSRSLSKATLFQSAVGGYILQNIHRIRTLSCICYHKQTLINIMNSVSRLSAPGLQRLVMKYDIASNSHPRPNNRSTPVLNGGAPRLSYLETDMIDTRTALGSLRNLTTLDMHLVQGSTRHTYDSFVEMLKAPQSLLYLSLDGYIDINSWPLHSLGPQFELSKLKGLRLIDSGMMAVKFILSLSAPQLKTLWLDCSFDNFTFLIDAPQMAAVNGHVKFPALRYLTMVNDPLFLSENFSAIFPTVTHLHLPHAYFSHMSKLDKALETRWTSLDTLAFTMFREGRSTRTKLYTALGSVFGHRRAQGRPIRRLLVDRDHYRDMVKDAPGMLDKAEVKVISSVNYDEDWWNKVDQQHL